MILEARNIHKDFVVGGRPLAVLAGVSLDISEGEIIALVGPSGCGKTTFLRIISRLLQPTHGQVTYFGDCSAERLAIVWQEHRLFPWRTVWQNVNVGLEFQGQRDHEVIRENLDITGLSECAALYPGQLSHGMRQRVALARALAVKPKVLLLDEPFSSIHFQLKQRLLQDLMDLRERRGLAIILVSHDVRDAQRIADRLYVFSEKPVRVTRLINRSELDAMSEPELALLGSD